ncbi:hypothetical protein MTBPR1_30059 [Candidatus Terasakiella magnetica]|uniref:Uncharacterized protein n=1 Tax=Candidatus Terasakiella magnetica TaxID=1867952 RepID=A0A1C3RHE1_9PROT|nr:hypothetical protein [Candidatus Terasakiella magnetica]SCA56689.1 hypothetical protein MTBPR1_30059 [Candidatus Terasakiella magnetica]
MGEIVNLNSVSKVKQEVPLIARAIVIESLEELREAMTETLGYAELVGCDIEQVRKCIKVMADSIEPGENGGEHS